jgi:MFS family permease
VTDTTSAIRSTTFGLWPLVVLTAVGAVDAANRQILGVVANNVQDALDVSDSTLGLIGASFAIVSVVGVIPFGTLADRMQHRLRLIAVATMIAAVMAGASGLAIVAWQLIVTQMLLGVVEGFGYPAGFSLLGDYYPVEQRGRVQAIAGTSFIIGIFAALAVGSAINVTFGWRAAVAFWAMPTFLIALLLLRLREPPRGHQDARAEVPPGTVSEVIEETPDVGLHDYSQLPLRVAARQLWNVHTFRIQLPVLILTQYLPVALGFWVIKFFEDEHDMSNGGAAGLASILVIGGLLGGIGGGYLADRLVARGRVNGRLEVSIVGGVAAGLLYIPALALDSLPLAAVFFLLASVPSTAPLAPINAIITDTTVPELRGRAAAFRSVAFTGTTAVAVLLTGVLAQALGLRAAVLFGAPLAVAGGLVGILGLRSYRADAARVVAHAKRLVGE